jgi:hypothetical protein
MFQSTRSLWHRLVGRREAVRNEERRLWVRYPAEMVAILQPAATPEPETQEPERISSVVRDISLGGVNLLVDRKFEEGQLLTIELPLPGAPGPQSVLACVVRANEEKPGQWALGCVFSRELANEDLEGLGARRLRNRRDDQRMWVRFPTDVEARYQKVGDVRNEACAARVLNVSPTGVGLLVNDSVEAGALLTVDLHGRSHRTILACVVHVTPREDGVWALGCNFIRELTEDDLKALL